VAEITGWHGRMTPRDYAALTPLIRRKQKIVTIEGVEYRLRARIHQSFGEDVFRVTIKKG
jgi:hypothetical protein